ncbi:MAG: tRNA (cytidine(34)-2'-O)-methyltransferase [Planctomycetota bacterium]
MTLPPLYTPVLHVVLYEPEIPQNTGNIGRLCVAAHAQLHLAGPLGFSLNAKARRRAGLDYWERLVWSEHATFEDLAAGIPRERLYFFTKTAGPSLYDTGFKPGDYLVFGGETRGLPDKVKEAYADRMVRIPMLGDVRSLNLANAVSIAVYEALRQAGQFREGQGS